MTDFTGEIYRKQGYLVMACPSPQKVGDVIDLWGMETQRNSQPLRVVSESTRAEHWAQVELWYRLAKQQPRSVNPALRYFYRVESD